MVEQGLRPPSEALSKFYDEHYETRGVLVDLGGFARADSSGFPDWVDREQAATDIRTYEMGYIPGLLQTADYARTLIEALSPWAQDVEEQVQMRLARQAVLQHAQMRAIIEQSAIERIVGSPEIQLAQLTHLLDQPKNVTVQVVPTLAGLHPGVAGPLMLLGFDKARPLARVDGRGQGEVFDSPQDVRREERAFDAIIAAAMPAEQSAEYIEAVVEELQAMISDLSTAPWRKSSYSGGANTNCVEVAPLPRTVGVRDTKNREAGYLTVSRSAWHAFVHAWREADLKHE